MNTYGIDFFDFDRYSPEQLGEMVVLALGDAETWSVQPKLVLAAYAHLLRGIGPYKIPVHGLAEPLHVRYTPTGLLVALRAPDLALPQFLIAASQVLLVCEQTIETERRGKERQAIQERFGHVTAATTMFQSCHDTLRRRSGSTVLDRLADAIEPAVRDWSFRRAQQEARCAYTIPLTALLSDKRDVRP